MSPERGTILDISNVSFGLVAINFVGSIGFRGFGSGSCGEVLVASDQFDRAVMTVSDSAAILAVAR